MVVTCHFIDATWSLNRYVLNFCSLLPPHTGHAIAEILLKCFRDWGIENKICSIIVDNAKANDLVMRQLRDVYISLPLPHTEHAIVEILLKCFRD